MSRTVHSLEGDRALHNAVVHGRADLDLIDLLLSAGADVDARTTKGFTPLHLTAHLSDSGDAAAILLRRGVAKDAIASCGGSPLHFAAEHDRRGRDRLHPRRLHKRAAGHGCLPRRGRSGQRACPARLGLECPLQCTTPRGGTGRASWTPSRRDRETTPLLCTLENLCVEAMRALLEHGVFIRANQRCSPLLHLAAEQSGKDGATEAVDLLLRWGADESELDRDVITAAEVVGADGVPGNTTEALNYGVCTEQSLETDADRVRELLVNAPADTAWRRRGLLLLCLARNQTPRRSSESWREGKGKGAEGGGRGPCERRWGR